MKVFFLCQLLFTLFTSSVVQANTDELIQSISGGAPFLISYDDGHGSSKRQEGIYVRSNDGGWNLILPGKVLPAPIVGGVHLQLSLTQSTKRYESIIILDNRPTIFSARSDEFKPDSFYTVGSPEHPLIDPSDQSELVLPELTSADQINLVEKLVQTSEGNYQIVLGSVKQPHLKGSGITFGFALRISDNTDAAIVVRHQPIILSWNFTKTADLEKFLYISPHQALQNTGLISFPILEKFSRTAKNVIEDKALKNWRNDLKGFFKNKDELPHWSQVITDEASGSVPFINIMSNELEIQQLPRRVVSISGGNQVFTVSNPLTGKEIISTLWNNKAGKTFDRVSLVNFDMLPILISPGLNCDADGCDSMEVLENSQNAINPSLIQTKDGKLFFHIQNRNKQRELIELKPVGLQNLAGFAPSKFSVTSSFIEQEYFVYISWELNHGDTKVAETDVYQFVEKSGRFFLEHSIKISDLFYTAEEIRYRLNTFSGVLVFDNLTKHVDSVEEYLKLRKLTLPHIDIRASLDYKTAEAQGTRGVLVDFFPQSLSKIPLSQQLEYVIYEEAEKSNAKKRTGIYKKVEENVAPPLIQSAELLDVSKKVEGKKVDPQYLLGDTKLTFRENEPLDLKVYAVDLNHRKGESSFVVNFILGSDKPGFNPVLYSFTLAAPIQNLISFGVLKPEGGPRKDQFLLVAYMVIKGGSYIMPVVVTEERRGDQLSHTIRGGLPNWVNVSVSILNDQEIKSRIRFDIGEKITPYWIVDPSIDDQNLNYKLYDLLQNKTIEPNKLKEKKSFHEADSTSYSLFGSFYEASWRHFPDYKVREHLDKIARSSVYQNDIFPNLKQTLEDLADPDKPATHTVLIVPEELKNYASEYVYALRKRSNNKAKFWSEKNDLMEFFVIDQKKVDQEKVLVNLDVLREKVKEYNPRKRGVLFSTLGEISRFICPQVVVTDKSEPFYLEKHQSTDRGLRIDTDDSADAEPQTSAMVPSFLYLNAVEGERVQLAQYRDFSKTYSKKYSSLFIGTQEEWSEIVRLSGKYIGEYNVVEDYKTVELETPTFEFRNEQFKKILERPEIKSFGFRIDVESVSGPNRNANKSPEEVLSSYVVNRVEALSKSNNMSSFEAFNRALPAFVSSLNYDSKLRNERVISRGVVERILQKVFVMPINLNLLPPHHPLRVLSRPEAPYLWMKAGYLGTSALKRKIIKTILSQLSSDQVKNLSSSFILLGDSGTGKTELIKSLQRMLGLKSYNFSIKEPQPEASFFFLQMPKIQETRGSVSDASSISLDEAIEHLDYFLATDAGEGGFIVLDDFHLAPPKVRAYFAGRIRSLIDNPTFEIRRGSIAKEAPTRNLVVAMTLNPTENQEKLAKYKKDGGALKDADLILATISSSEVEIDGSFLNRIGEIINLSKFPVEAKAPLLQKSASARYKADFTNNQRLILANNDTYDSIVNKFPNENARIFLSSASQGLLSNASSYTNGNFLILVPRRTSIAQHMPGASALNMRSNYADSGGPGLGSSGEIERFIYENIEPFSIENSPRGKLEFTKHFLNNFRVSLYEAMLASMNILETGQEATNAREKMFRQAWLSPFNRAFVHHLEYVPTLGLDDTNLDAAFYGTKTKNDKALFAKTLNAMNLDHGLTAQKLPKVGILPPSQLLQEFTSEHLTTNQNVSRQNVLNSYMNELEKLFEDCLSKFIKVGSFENLPSNEAWLRSLKPIDQDAYGELRKELDHILKRFTQEIYSPLYASSASAQPDQYDVFRLFMMTVDRAISHLPWDKSSGFLIQAIEIATRDMTFGQAPGVQHFLFESSPSPITALGVTTVVNIAKDMPFYASNEEGGLDRQKAKFIENCERFLTKKE